MTRLKKKLRIGIVGCGAIGSRLAKSIARELKNDCTLSGLYDIDKQKSFKLAENIKRKKTIMHSLKELIAGCDLMVEAVNAKETKDIIRLAVQSKKHVLAMSVGKLLNAQDVFKLAQKNRCTILIPSGAICGLDAIKAASLTGITSLTLTTRKPPSGFANVAHIKEKGIDLEKIDSETIIFDGDVDTAVKLFPVNINVASTLALACGDKRKLRVRIITAPDFKRNSHEIEAIGDFGRIVSMTDNVVCPDNPKTSYLAVLSAIQTLKQFFSGVKIGT